MRAVTNFGVDRYALVAIYYKRKRLTMMDHLFLLGACRGEILLITFEIALQYDVSGIDNDVIVTKSHGLGSLFLQKASIDGIFAWRILLNRLLVVVCILIYYLSDS